MRARGIKPGFYKNADLAECSAFARLLAPGLWMLADRDGRLEDRPKQIKGEIFPYDSVDVDALLSELVKWNHIIRYQVDGKNYIQIANFAEHQNPHQKEKQSLIPPPTESPVITRLSQESCERAVLIPSSLIPDSSSNEEMAKTQKSDFSELWAEFQTYEMGKGSKKKAWEAYLKACKRANKREIHAGLKPYYAECLRTKCKTQHVATWLNSDGWANEYMAEPAKPEPPDPNRIIGREEYDRCKKIIGVVLDKAPMRAIIQRYEAQNATQH